MAQGLSTATASPTLKSKSHCQYHSKSREALHLNANNLYNIKSTLFYLVIYYLFIIIHQFSNRSNLLSWVFIYLLFLFIYLSTKTPKQCDFFDKKHDTLRNDKKPK